VTYRLVDVENEAGWHAYHAIRRSVLWEARGRSNYDDCHEGEYRPNRYPLLLKLAARSIGTTRLVWSEDEIARSEAGIVQLIKNIG